MLVQVNRTGTSYYESLLCCFLSKNFNIESDYFMCRPDAFVVRTTQGTVHVRAV